LTPPAVDDASATAATAQGANRLNTSDLAFALSVAPPSGCDKNPTHQPEDEHQCLVDSAQFMHVESPRRAAEPPSVGYVERPRRDPFTRSETARAGRAARGWSASSAPSRNVWPETWRARGGWCRIWVDATW